MFFSIIGELFIYFVGDKEQIVFFGQFGQSPDFILCEYGSGRIIGRTDKNSPGSTIDLFFNFGEVW